MNGPLKEGDQISIHGQTCVGEIVAIKRKCAIVDFVSIAINIPLQRLERAQIDVTTQSNPATPLNSTVMYCM